MTENPRVQAALDYASRGWQVIRLHGLRADQSIGGCTCERGPKCPTPGKHPTDTAWQKGSRLTAEEIPDLWGGWRANHNVGIATGEASGFWVLDIDPDKGGRETLHALELENAVLPITLMASTGSGGTHYYFTLPDFPITNSTGRLPKDAGIDVRGTGGQVVAPPSATDKGPYTWINDGQPIGPAPTWLLDLLRPVATTRNATPTLDNFGDDLLDDADRKRLRTYAEEGYRREIARLDECKAKGWDGPPWDATTFEVACNLIELANASWSPFTVEQVQLPFMDHAPSDAQFGPREHEAKWASALKKIGDTPRPMPSATIDIFSGPDVRIDPRLTARKKLDEVTPPGRQIVERSWDDMGNAMRLVDHFGDVLRFVKETESWARYANGRWALDKSAAQSLIHDLLDGRLLATEAMLYSDLPEGDSDKPKPSQRDQFRSFVAKQRMSSRIQACKTEAAGRLELHASINDFDADPLLLNVANGVIDLTTSALRPHDPDLLLRQQSPVEYDPTAPCEMWQAFLDRVMPEQDMQTYLQRAVGYSITGSTNEQALFMHYGSGANGKSVFLEVMSAITGSYGQTVPRETLLVRNNGATEHPTAVARMAGMRFLQVSETAAGRRLDEEMVKALTGGEKQTARFMNRDFFDFKPTGKIHYVTNHLPRLTDAESIWRRLQLIAWRVRILDSEQDKDLAQKIIARELPGVLAWAVRGAAMWLEVGLKPPAKVTDDLAQYRQDQDVFGDFLFEVCVPAPEHFVTSTSLYNAYQMWSMQNGQRTPMTQQAFVATLKERGYSQKRTANSRGFYGLALRSEVTVS